MNLNQPSQKNTPVTLGRHRSLLQVIGLAIMLACSVACTSFSPEQPTQDELRITIRLDRETVRRGSPVTLRIDYVNHSDKAIDLLASGGAVGGWFSGDAVLISHRGETTMHQFFGINPTPCFQNIPAGATWSRTFMDLGKEIEHTNTAAKPINAFSRTGKYHIQCMYKGDYQPGQIEDPPDMRVYFKPIVSHTVTVRIK